MNRNLHAFEEQSSKITLSIRGQVVQQCTYLFKTSPYTHPRSNRPRPRIILAIRLSNNAFESDGSAICICIQGAIFQGYNCNLTVQQYTQDYTDANYAISPQVVGMQYCNYQCYITLIYFVYIGKFCCYEFGRISCQNLYM